MTDATVSLPPGYREIPDRMNIAAELIDRIEERGFGDRAAFIWDDGELSFAKFAVRVNKLAHGFTSNGIEKGMPVLIRMNNCHEFAEAVLALLKVGALPAQSQPSPGELIGLRPFASNQTIRYTSGGPPVYDSLLVK